MPRKVEASDKKEERPSPREFFSRHAAAYAANKGFAHGSDLERLITLIRPKRSETALDVATGTGFTALEIAPHVMRVVGIDITDEMLEEARRLSEERKIRNAVFENADAMRLPYPDSSFGIVTCRRAAHHFADIGMFLREAERVLTKKGRLGVVDMSPPEGTEYFFNSIEILRDSTHVKALTEKQWKSSVMEAGFSVSSCEMLPEWQTYEGWLSPVKIGGKEDRAIRKAVVKAPKNVLDALELTIKGGRVEGFTKNRIVLVAEK